MQQLDPKSVWLFFFGFISRLLVPLLIFGGYLFILTFSYRAVLSNSSMSLDIFNWLWLLVPLVILFCFFWAKLSYRSYRYELAENGFNKESGVIYKRSVTIPYERIQNVDINRGLAARILGLSDLQIQTAGYSATVSRYGIAGAGAEGRLPGLRKEVAEKLRDELIERSRHFKNQAL